MPGTAGSLFKVSQSEEVTDHGHLRNNEVLDNLGDGPFPGPRVRREDRGLEDAKSDKESFPFPFDPSESVGWAHGNSYPEAPGYDPRGRT